MPRPERQLAPRLTSHGLKESPGGRRDDNLVLLYSPARGVAYGKVFEGGARSTLIGAPPPAIAAELERLWRKEWRQGG